MKSFKNVNQAWVSMVHDVLSEGNEISGTRELNNVAFRIEDVKDNLVMVREPFSLVYYIGESIWYGAGKNDVDFISRIGKIWELLSDDGVTNNSAYGYILKEKFGFNQIEKMVELLTIDPVSRRAVININTPRENVIETKDEFCTIALQFILRDGKLNATGIMRSNDLNTGTPYDIFYFTEIQKYIASKLGVETGTYTHFVTSLHIYDRDFDKMIKSYKRYINDPEYLPIHNGKKIESIDGQKLLEKADELYATLKPLSRKATRTEAIKLCEQMGIIKYKK